MIPSHLEGGTERRQGTAWMRGQYLGGHERDVTARWTRRSRGLPVGEDSDQGRGPGKQRGKGPQVVQAFASVLYSVKRGAKLPNPPDQGTARGADGKVSPSQSLRRSLERRSQTRRRHLTHTHIKHRKQDINIGQRLSLTMGNTKYNNTLLICC